MRIASRSPMFAVAAFLLLLAVAASAEQQQQPQQQPQGERTLKRALSGSSPANGALHQAAKLVALRQRFGFRPLACDKGTYACADGTGCCDFGTSCGTAYTCGVEYCCKGGSSSYNYCFAADSLVTRQENDGSATRVPLASVRVGERVLTLTEDGQAAFEPVLYLPHALGNKERAAMRQISFRPAASRQGEMASSAAGSLTASHDHVLFVQKASTTTSAQESFPPSLTLMSANLLPAGEVAVGDLLPVSACTSTEEAVGVCTETTLVWQEVTAVADVEVEGLQNPWTASGRVVVGDVLVSPFRSSTLASYRALLSSTAAVLRPLGVEEPAAHALAHRVYTAYLAWFRQAKPAALIDVPDVAYVAGIVVAAAAAGKLMARRMMGA